jgi:hypothetical protein
MFLNLYRLALYRVKILKYFWNYESAYTQK